VCGDGQRFLYGDRFSFMKILFVTNHSCDLETRVSDLHCQQVVPVFNACILAEPTNSEVQNLASRS